MKKFLLFFLIAQLFMLTNSCKKEKVFKGQLFGGFYPESINDLKSFYEGGFVAIDNGLTITEIQGLENLEYLSNLKRVNGPVIIGSNPDLISLVGLENLESIYSTENFFGNLSIKNNPRLKSLKGLNNLKRIEKSLFIYNNQELEDCTGLKNLQELNSIFYFHDNNNIVSLTDFGNELISIDWIEITNSERLIEISGFEKLSEPCRQIAIMRNPELQTVHGFSQLPGVHDFIISTNNQLVTINAFHKLKSIENVLSIIDNAELPNIEFLSDVDSIGRVCEIELCSSLKSLDGLDHAVFFKNSPRTTIRKNDSLVDLCAIRNLLKSTTGFSSYAVEDNAYNPTKEEIINGECRLNN